MRNELLNLLSDCSNTMEKELINILGEKAEKVGSTIKHQVYKAAELTEKNILKHFNITDIEKTFETYKNEIIEVLEDNIDILGSSWTTDLYICGEYIPMLNNRVEVEKLELEEKKAMLKFKILFFLDDFKTIIKNNETYNFVNEAEKEVIETLKTEIETQGFLNNSDNADRLAEKEIKKLFDTDSRVEKFEIDTDFCFDTILETTTKFLKSNYKRVDYINAAGDYEGFYYLNKYNFDNINDLKKFFKVGDV